MKTDSFVLGVKTAQREGANALSSSQLAKILVGALHEYSSDILLVEAEVIVGDEESAPAQTQIVEPKVGTIIPFPGRRITEAHKPVSGFQEGLLEERGRFASK